MTIPPELIIGLIGTAITALAGLVGSLWANRANAAKTIADAAAGLVQATSKELEDCIAERNSLRVLVKQYEAKDV